MLALGHSTGRAEGHCSEAAARLPALLDAMPASARIPRPPRMAAPCRRYSRNAFRRDAPEGGRGLRRGLPGLARRGMEMDTLETVGRIALDQSAPCLCTTDHQLSGTRVEEERHSTLSNEGGG